MMSNRVTLVSRWRSAMFLVATLFICTSSTWTAHAMLPLCSDVCGPDTPCTRECISDINTLTRCDVYPSIDNGTCYECDTVCSQPGSCGTECVRYASSSQPGKAEFCGDTYGPCN